MLKMGISKLLDNFNIKLSLLIIISFLISPMIFSQNNCLQFDGENDYINCGSSNLYIPSNAISLLAWIKTDATGDIQTVLWRGDVWMNYMA